jgi:membrane-bound inhibitor of C-type lysozyme
MHSTNLVETAAPIGAGESAASASLNGQVGKRSAEIGPAAPRRGALRGLTLATAAALVAAACALPGRTPDRPPLDRYLRYVCADKQELGITFQQEGKRALVVAGGWSHLLPQVPSASGVRYSDGKVTLRTKGMSASLDEDGRTTYRDCTPSGKK